MDLFGFADLPKGIVVDVTGINCPGSDNPLALQVAFTVTKFAGGELQRFVEQHDWKRNLEHCDPLATSERTHLEHGAHDVHVEQHEVQGHGQSYG